MRDIRKEGATVILSDGTTVVADITKSISFNGSSDITSHPVERGFDITQGVSHKNLSISASFVFALGEDLEGLENESKLESARKLGMPVSLVTSKGSYSNLIIKSVSTEEGFDTCNVSVSFEQVRFAQTEEVDVPESLRGDQRKRRGKESNKGRQGGEDVGAASAGDATASAVDSAVNASKEQKAEEKGSSIIAGFF